MEAYISFTPVCSLISLTICPGAAFDTVDHDIQIGRLENWVGLAGLGPI